MRIKRIKMTLFVCLPRAYRLRRQALALVPSAPSLLRQVRSRRQQSQWLTSISSLQQKQSQYDPRAPAQNTQNTQNTQNPETLESIKPETLQKIDTARSSGGQKKDSLLAEQNVSNKEQRKADWAIMKEMSRYLWPKVGGHTMRSFSQCLIT